MTLLFGLVIALRGTTETVERVRAYTAFTQAMTVRWPQPHRPGRTSGADAQGAPAAEMVSYGPRVSSSPGFGCSPCAEFDRG
ncbi:MAG: hypothetical protein ACRDRS_25700, partial [Pseudonocardiaceae bacterium]